MLYLTAATVLLPGLCLADATPDAEQRIRVSPRTPWYWSYGGRTLLLLGGSDEDNLFNHPELMMDNMAKLQACGGNYIRGTLSCRDEGNVWPFLRTGDRYDLRGFNPDFWQRLENCCREGQARGVIIQIEVWATFDFYRDFWLVNPWNPANNVNYTAEATGLQPEWPHHPAARFQPFFETPPELKDIAPVREFQQAFVRKVLDVTLPFPNVLYCLDNETRTPPGWTLYWGRFIRRELATRGVTANLTQMWDPWDLRDEAHAVTYGNPDIFNFCEVSQNNWQVGQTHYDRLLWYRNNLKTQPGGPRPMNNVKVYGRPGGGKPCDPEENVARFWRNIFAGCAGTRFHRPDSGLGLNDLAQRTIRAARTFTNAFDLFSCEPRPDVPRDAEPNQVYCLARSPDLFALYLPKGGEVVIKTAPAQGLRLRWFDPETALFGSPEAVPAGDEVRLGAPSAGRTWLALIDRR